MTTTTTMAMMRMMMMMVGVDGGPVCFNGSMWENRIQAKSHPSALLFYFFFIKATFFSYLYFFYFILEYILSTYY